MNAERLTEFLSDLLDADAHYDLQMKFEALQEALSSVSSSPGTTSYQNALAETMTAFQKSVVDMARHFTPAERERLGEVNASEWFDLPFSERVMGIIRENPLTPSVASEELLGLVGKRAAFLMSMSQTQEGLTLLGFPVRTLLPGTAEIAVSIPRVLFSDDLAGLSSELRTLTSVFRVFSEVATGSVEPVRIIELSSSDPTFGFGLSPETIEHIGRTFAWAAKALKTISELKESVSKLRGQGFSAAVTKKADEDITSRIEKEVKDQVKVQLANLQADGGRAHELETGMKWSVEAILARVERGMTVEIRLLPPPTEQGVGSESEARQSEAFAALAQVRDQLAFEPARGQPVVALPAPEPPQSLATVEAGDA